MESGSGPGKRKRKRKRRGEQLAADRQATGLRAMEQQISDEQIKTCFHYIRARRCDKLLNIASGAVNFTDSSKVIFHTRFLFEIVNTIRYLSMVTSGGVHSIETENLCLPKEKQTIEIKSSILKKLPISDQNFFP